MNYMRYMEWIIARHNPNVVLGDLNEVFFKESVLLRFLTQLSFIQTMLEPTHIRGSLFNHIYLKDDLINSHFFP